MLNLGNQKNEIELFFLFGIEIPINIRNITFFFFTVSFYRNFVSVEEEKETRKTQVHFP